MRKVFFTLPVLLITISGNRFESVQAQPSYLQPQKINYYYDSGRTQYGGYLMVTCDQGIRDTREEGAFYAGRTMFLPCR